MPLDPQLINGIRLPEVQPYGAAAANAMSLSQMAQRGRRGEQELAQGDREAAAATREQQLRDLGGRLTIENTDANGITNHEAIGLGLVNNGYGQEGAAYLAQARTAAKAQAEAEQAKKVAQAKLDHAEISNALAAVQTAAPGQEQATLTAVRGRLLARGKIQPADLSETYNPAEILALAAEGRDAKEQIDAWEKAQTRAETHENNVGTRANVKAGQESVAATAAAGQVLTEARDKASATNQAGQLRVAQGQLSVAQGGLALRREEFKAGQQTANPTGSTATGEEFLKTLNPGMQATVRAIASGRQINLPRDKSFGPLMQAVNQFDPTYTATRGKIRAAFVAGPDGRNIGALNTATDHLDQLHEAAKAMKNGSWQPGNAAYNYVAEKFGKAAPTNYKFVMNALAGEAASALKGNATDPEIAHVMETLKPDMSPEQAAGVAISGLHVFGAKLNTYDERYHREVADDPNWSPVLPTAKAIFKRYNVGVLRREKEATPAPDKIKFKQTWTGPNGQRIGSNDGGASYFDVQTGKRVQ